MVLDINKKLDTRVRYLLPEVYLARNCKGMVPPKLGLVPGIKIYTQGYGTYILRAYLPRAGGTVPVEYMVPIRLYNSLQ